MRALILMAGAALSLAACGSNDQTENMTNLGDSLTAESIVANDVTAIDAVTGDAANMAADVDINFTNDLLDSGNGSGNVQARARTARPPARPAPSPRESPTADPAEEPVANTTANSAEQP